MKVIQEYPFPQNLQNDCRGNLSVIATYVVVVALVVVLVVLVVLVVVVVLSMVTSTGTTSSFVRDATLSTTLPMCVCVSVHLNLL
jgi:hypothetical protein